MPAKFYIFSDCRLGGFLLTSLEIFLGDKEEKRKKSETGMKQYGFGANVSKS